MYGGKPAERQQFEIAFELGLRHLEPLGELGDGHTGVREHVGNEREHTSQSRSDERARAHGARVHDRAEPRDDVGAQLVGTDHLGMIEQVEHPRAERGAVDDRERHLDGAVGAAFDDGLFAELLDHPARA